MKQRRLENSHLDYYLEKATGLYIDLPNHRYLAGLVLISPALPTGSGALPRQKTEVVDIECFRDGRHQ